MAFEIIHETVAQVSVQEQIQNWLFHAFIGLKDVPRHGDNHGSFQFFRGVFALQLQIIT